MRTQVNVRVPDTTRRQLEELTKAGYESQAHAVIVAVDRLYQQEMKNMNNQYRGFEITVTEQLTGYGYAAVGPDDGMILEVPSAKSGSNYGTTFDTPEAAILAAKKAIGMFWNSLEYESDD